MHAFPYQRAVEMLRSRTGIVISVHFPAAAVTTATALLNETVDAFRREVDRPDAICLSVDGGGTAAETVARRLAATRGVQVVVAERNRGKLQAVRAGMQRLLTNSDHEFLAVVDQDGDHFANELLSFLRLLGHMQTHAGVTEAMILGRRISRHRPMGFLRGELEELADRVLLDALHYDAAVRGVPLHLGFATVLDEYPDFHSGYKLFTRATAKAVFLTEPELCGVPEACYYRHAVEAVMTVEAWRAGAVLGLVNRSTIDEQPLTTFGLLNRQRLVADKIIWPCKRLGVPSAFVDQWLRNHIPRLLLGTLVPDGEAELATIRSLVMEAFGGGDGLPPVVRPHFV